jgi:hypothetical protein
MLVTSGVTLLLDAAQRRRNRRDLLERLRPYHPSLPSIADEAQAWLKKRLPASKHHAPHSPPS